MRLLCRLVECNTSCDCMYSDHTGKEAAVVNNFCNCNDREDVGLLSQLCSSLDSTRRFHFHPSGPLNDTGPPTSMSLPVNVEDF